MGIPQQLHLVIANCIPGLSVEGGSIVSFPTQHWQNLRSDCVITDLNIAHEPNLGDVIP